MIVSLISYAYSLNQYYDERLRKKYFLLPLLLYIFSLAFLIKEYVTIIFSLIFFSLATLYSFKKIYLKKTPLATVIDPIGHSLLFLIGYGNIDNYSIAIFSLFLFLLTLSRILHELHHFNYDKKNRIKNASILIGKTNSVKLFRILGISTIIYIAFIYANAYLNSILTICLILFVTLFTITIREEVTLGYRMLFRYLAILIGCIWLTTLLF